mmetsp:Transcript_98214/g.174853  ORF Transcript_98214/g.174853 Transcript_98214/m.174853 type:complete len:498 (+) Transcript_98214:35-1528(+)
MKSAMALSLLLCTAFVGALAKQQGNLRASVLSATTQNSTMLEMTSDSVVPKEKRKSFVALEGNGWCVDGSGKESVARTDSLRMSCATAQNLCLRDDMCVAFACVTDLEMAVLYTTTNCAFACDNLNWIVHPDAIAKSGYDRYKIEMAPWKRGTCFVVESSRNGDIINSHTGTTSCDFETDLCGWQPTGLYKWKIGGGTAKTPETGPRAAHGGTGYALVDASGINNPSKKFLLDSPALQSGATADTQTVLYFWYHMQGTNMGSLKLICDADTEGGKKIEPFSKSGDQGQGWKKGMVEVPPTQCTFEATTGSSEKSDIALDDIVLYQVEDQAFTCDFETNLCDWEIGAEGGWQRNKHGTTGTGVKAGTTGPKSGAEGLEAYYVYLETNPDNYPKKTFTFSSKEFLAATDSDIKFKYNMNGKDMGTLKLVATLGDDTTETIFEKSGQQGDEDSQGFTPWLEATATVPKNTKKLTFMGTTGDSTTSDMAIDAIQYKFGKLY